MCGISLIFHTNGVRPDENQLLRMNKALAHRGPDDSGIAIRNNAGLGHTRLSIVDIADGAQPLYSNDGRWCIVFNGEIYNYLALRNELKSAGIKFKTKTDTEVVLQLYVKEGPKSVQRLRGMFAFVIHDLETGQAFIARDRLGIKPLYYHWNNTTLTAASEIKALFASGLVEPEFNHASIINYFKYQNGISPHTIFKDVYELPPGHTMVMGSGAEPGVEPVLSEYWNIEFPVDGEYDSGDEADWTQRFEDALADAVQTHTIGEVPIGAYLSGGIDSATMAWMLKNQYSENFKTFSIRFTNPSQDESEIFRRISKHLDISNEELELDDQRESGYLSELEQCLYHLEQPQRVAVDIPHYMLSDLVRNQDHKVVYTGDGADEILGGYDCYRMDHIRYSGNQLDPEKQRKKYYASEFGESFSGDFLNMSARLHEPKNQQRVINKFGCYPAWHDSWHITETLLPDLFTDGSSVDKAEQQMDELAAQMKPHLEGRHILNQSLYIETKTRLPGWILLKSDRLSMAHGVEARVPFLDHPLVELTASIPPRLKLNGMNEKYVLKQVAMPNLPDINTDFKKRAFYTPIKEWFFTNERSASLEPYLSNAALEESNIFNPEQVKKLYQRLVDSKAPDDLDSYYRVMQLEWVLLLVLTVQILYSQFIKKQAPCFSNL